MKSKIVLLPIVAMFFALGCIVVFADPEDANIVQAQGGNLTSLLIGAPGAGASTKHWQGYFGNITGGVVIADSNNVTLYEWGAANPDGEIFAANSSTVDWQKIDCINFTTNTSVLKYNISDLNEFIGLVNDEQGAVDSVNATFNQTYGDDGSSFLVASKTIDNAENCSMVTLHDENGYQTTKFKEVLLTDNHSIIFTSIMEQNTPGFNNVSVDFEMIVGVNGSDSVRTFYFFVELT